MMNLTSNPTQQKLNDDDLLALTNKLVRNRDSAGDPLHREVLYHEPIGIAEPSQATAEDDYIRFISKESPLFGAKLRALHDTRVIHSVRALHALDRQQREDLAALQKRSIQNDQEIDQKVELVKQKIDQVTHAYESQLSDALMDVEKERSQATLALASLGIDFDDSTDVNKILQAPLIDRAKAADELKIPFEEPRTPIAKFLKVAASGICGSVLGLNIGIVADFLSPDDISGNSMLIPLVIIGIASGTLVAAFLGNLSYIAATESYLDRSDEKRKLKYGLTIGAAFFCCLAYAYFDSIGILKFAALDGQHLSILSSLIVGSIIGVGYLLFSVTEGYLNGRRSVNTNRLQAYVQTVNSERQVARLKDPSLHEVILRLGVCREKEAKLATIQRQFDLKIDHLMKEMASLEARRIPYPTDFTPQQKLMYEDAHMQMVGTHFEYAYLKYEIESQLFPPKNRLLRFFHDWKFSTRGEPKAEKHG